MFGYTDVEPSQLKRMLTDQDVLLVDVRTPTESARASIPGAHNIPLHLLPLRKQDLAGDRTIVFYCQSGNRSAQACAFMVGQGWSNVCNLRGGIAGWLQHGQSVAAPAN